MAALPAETQITIYDEDTGKKVSNIAEISFNPGETEKYLSIGVTDGNDNRKIMVEVDKNDAIMLKLWLESTIILME